MMAGFLVHFVGVAMKFTNHMILYPKHPRGLMHSTRPPQGGKTEKNVDEISGGCDRGRNREKSLY